MAANPLTIPTATAVTASVTDVVIAEITECHYSLAGFKCRSISGSMDLIPADPVRLACLITRLPDIRTVGILQLTARRKRLVIYDEGSVLASITF